MHAWGIPLTLAYIALFTWLITRLKHFETEKISRKLIVLFFFYKIFLGIALTLIYTYYYTDTRYSDVYKYYHDSYYMTQALWQHPADFFKMLFGIGNDTQYFTDMYYSKMDHWFRLYETQQYNDNHTMIRFNALVRVFSGGYFYIHTVFMCFLSFWGMVSFFRGFALFLPAHKHLLLGLGLFLFPSLNFWSAGVLKEGLLIFAMGNIFYAACLLARKEHRYKYYLLALFSIVLSLYLKSYTLAALTVGLSGLLLSAIFRYKKVWLVYTGVLAGLILFIVAAGIYYPQYSIPDIIAQKQWNFVRLSNEMNAGSTFDIGELEPTWGNILSMAPKALFTGVFRPMPYEANNILALMTSAESILFLLGLVLSIVFFERPDSKQLSMLFCALFIVVILGVLIGISTANFGSLVRYKVPFIPFVIFICLCLINTKKFLFLNGKTKSELLDVD